MKILIAIPAHNEEKIIQNNVLGLYNFCKQKLSLYDWKIVVADNSTSDKTKHIISGMLPGLPELAYLSVPYAGKGRAVKTAWERYDADIYCFMDADLSADLSSLPSLIQAIESEGYDIACGSRFHRDSHVTRPLTRKLISRAYRIVLFLAFHLKVRDAPCGFKAVSRKTKLEILPKVENNEWFFDSELVILAEKNNLKIKEIPVIWKEQTNAGRKSQVKILSLGAEYLKKVISLRRRLKL